MQDTAEGFGQPIRQIFEPFFRCSANCRRPSTPRRATGDGRRPLLALALPAHHRSWRPLARLIGLMQQGRIAVYLLYSFVTLVVTLLVVMR
jgi:hydrogenase-4 component B